MHASHLSILHDLRETWYLSSHVLPSKILTNIRELLFRALDVSSPTSLKNKKPNRKGYFLATGMIYLLDNLEKASGTIQSAKALHVLKDKKNMFLPRMEIDFAYKIFQQSVCPLGIRYFVNSHEEDKHPLTPKCKLLCGDVTALHQQYWPNGVIQHLPFYYYVFLSILTLAEDYQYKICVF